MMNLIVVLIQCGLFLAVPALVFSLGFWLIKRYFKKREDVTMPLLLGLTFSATTMVGMLIDPRGGFKEIEFIFKTSLAVGLFVTLFVIVGFPVFRYLLNLFNK